MNKSPKESYAVPEWMRQFLPLFQNTGGNDVEELLHDEDTNMFANSVRYMFIVSARSQFALLMGMHSQGLISQPVARKLKVHMPESFHPDGDIDAPLVLDELEVIEAIVEAGGMPVATCPRCKCELDLSHRPDGMHYCHSSSVDVKGE